MDIILLPWWQASCTKCFKGDPQENLWRWLPWGQPSRRRLVQPGDGDARQEGAPQARPLWGHTNVLHLKWKCSGMPIIIIREELPHLLQLQGEGQGRAGSHPVKLPRLNHHQEGQGTVQWSSWGGKGLCRPLWAGQQPESEERQRPPRPPLR